MRQMTGLHYLQQPWRLQPYWFSELQFNFFFFLPVDGFQSQWRAKKSATRSVSLWLTAVNHVSAGWESSFRERQGGRIGGRPFLPYLSFSFTASLCLLVWLSLLSATFYFPHSLLRLTWITLLIKLTLDFICFLPYRESDALFLIVCHFPDPPPPSSSYHSIAINSCFSTSGRENEFHAERCLNIQCKHAHMHFPVYCQPSGRSLLKQTEFRSCAIEYRRWWRHHTRQGDVTFISQLIFSQLHL